MKASELKIGTVYLMKVSGKITPCELISISVGWDGKTIYKLRNIITSRDVRAHSPSKFRRAVARRKDSLDIEQEIT